MNIDKILKTIYTVYNSSKNLIKSVPVLIKITSNTYRLINRIKFHLPYWIGFIKRRLSFRYLRLIYSDYKYYIITGVSSQIFKYLVKYYKTKIKKEKMENFLKVYFILLHCEKLFSNFQIFKKFKINEKELFKYETIDKLVNIYNNIGLNKKQLSEKIIVDLFLFYINN